MVQICVGIHSSRIVRTRWTMSSCTLWGERAAWRCWTTVEMRMTGELHVSHHHIPVFAYRVFCTACWEGGGLTFSPSPSPPPPPLPPPRPRRSCFPHPIESHHQLQSSAGGGSLRGPWPGQETGYDISGQKARMASLHYVPKEINHKPDLQVTELSLFWSYVSYVRWINQWKATTGTDTSCNVIPKLNPQDFFSLLSPWTQRSEVPVRDNCWWGLVGL